MAEPARSDIIAAAPGSVFDCVGERSPSARPVANPGVRARFAHYAGRPLEKMVPVACGILVISAISIGWLNRAEDYVTPKNGAGYWLGISGAGAMLCLLVYPIRKRVRVLRPVGSVAFWFRVHMLLGIIGPLLILFHANFTLGSPNSNVALFAMLTVACSGIVGRYLYGKVHLGLYGRKAEVKEIAADADALKQRLGAGPTVADEIVRRLDAFTALALTSPAGVLASALRLPVLRVRGRLLRRRLLANARGRIATEGKRRGWSSRVRRQQVRAVSELLALYFAAVHKAAAFTFYDRLFSLWHTLHLPLFILLVLAATIHIVAVHLY